jgi:hypothetical protein
MVDPAPRMRGPHNGNLGEDVIQMAPSPLRYQGVERPGAPCLINLVKTYSQFPVSWVLCVCYPFKAKACPEHPFVCTVLAASVP